MDSRPSSLAPAPCRILGIDPGSQRTGIGIIDVDEAGRSRHVFNCAINLLDNETFAARLKQLFDELGAIIADHTPHEVAIERVFVSRNADSALKLGQARGAAICAVVSRGLTISEYAARDTWLSGFLIAWASSSTTVSQVSAASRSASSRKMA
jgi:crossover junction endodeoxyribonuclease RuvC